MLLLKYINDNTIYEVEFTRNSENLVTIKGNLPAKKVGFTLNRSMSYADNWDYSTFKTVYRILDDGFQFSNDGSVWIAPPAPEYKVTFIAQNGSIEGEAVQVVKDYSEVVVPKVNAFENYTFQGWSEELPAEGEVTENKTVYAIMNYEEPVSLVIDRKIAELNSIQQSVINAGTDVVLSDGTVEHFTATAEDQISLMGLQAQVAMGLEQIPWHTSNHDEGCKYYSAADMNAIVLGVAAFVTFHVTLFRDLRRYVESLTDKNEVYAITYDIKSLPQEAWSEVLVDLVAKMPVSEKPKEEVVEEPVESTETTNEE